jgi:hypothetical protein
MSAASAAPEIGIPLAVNKYPQRQTPARLREFFSFNKKPSTGEGFRGHAATGRVEVAAGYCSAGSAVTTKSSK